MIMNKSRFHLNMYVKVSNKGLVHKAKNQNFQLLHISKYRGIEGDSVKLQYGH